MTCRTTGGSEGPIDTGLASFPTNETQRVALAALVAAIIRGNPLGPLSAAFAMEEVGGIIDKAIYGGKATLKAGQGFGTALYEIKEEKRKGCTYTAEVATFYKDYVVLRNAVQKGCLPMRYSETVMPKYRMCGAVISRGANQFLLMIGLVCLVIGVLAILTNLERKGGILLVGIILAIVGATLLLTPMCLTYYVTELQVLCDPDDLVSPKCGYTSYYLRTFKKPDDDFILLYVYGALNSNMAGYHSLSHLIDDSLVAKVKPRMMTSIQIDAEALPDSGLNVPGGGGKERRGSHSNNQGFGKQLYVLEQEAGLFGEAGGPCSKIAPVKSVVRACFCEHLLVVQNERKILCYPLSFEKFVIPKYKLASVNFRKGGSYATLIIGQVLLGVAIALGIIAAQSGDTLTDGGILAPLAIAAAVAGLVVTVLTLFKSVYSVDLVMQKKPVPKNEDPVSLILRALKTRIVGPEMVTLTSTQQAERA